MVNDYGWTEEKDYSTYPKKHWCDMDYIADWVKNKGYDPKTTMKNLILMILSHYYDDNNVKENGYFAIQDTRAYPDNLMIHIPDVEVYVEENGGLQEFDYKS